MQSRIALERFDSTNPQIVTQRPQGSGVPLNQNIVLVANEPLNTSTVTSGLHVSQNGVLVNGSVQVAPDGQTITFTPQTNWQYGAVIEVFMDTSVQDVSGNGLSSYSGSFTTVGNPQVTAANVVKVSPSGTAEPLNTVISIQFDKALNPSTVTSANLPFSGGAATVSLVGNGKVIRMVPSAQLQPNTAYYVLPSSQLLNLPSPPFHSPSLVLVPVVSRHHIYMCCRPR